ncbi:MAG: aminomethyl transferase family protein [Myxococcales bacterium]|nr:aminomethyl transferase family protein [Myxococcales bacterium]
MKALEQAAAVRRGAGLFRIAHRGLVAVEGADRVRWLDGMVSNDVAALAEGPERSGCQALLLTRQGRIVADLQVLWREAALWLDTESGAVAALMERLERHIIADAVTLADRSGAFARLGLEGPAVPAILERALEAPLSLAPDACADVRLAGVPGVAAAYGWSGEAAFQLFVPAEAGESVAAALGEAGAAEGLVEAEAEALEILRIEAGRPRLGADLDESVLPAEAGLERAISTLKGCYTGQEVVARLASQGQVAHQLVGLSSEGPALLAVGSAVRAGEQRIGEVTSACLSPVAGAIALAYVRRSHADPGTEVSAGGATARVVALPFVAGGS